MCPSLFDPVWDGHCLIKLRCAENLWWCALCEQQWICDMVWDFGFTYDVMIHFVWTPINLSLCLRLWAYIWYNDALCVSKSEFVTLADFEFTCDVMMWPLYATVNLWLYTLKHYLLSRSVGHTPFTVNWLCSKYFLL